MKLITASLLVSTVAATSSSIRAGSNIGKNILSKARRLDGGDNDGSWAVNYSLQFQKCATTHDYYGGYFGGNQNQNGNNRNNFNGMYEQRLVHFKLCPTDTCGKGCSGGADYVIDLNEYVQAYMEYQEQAKEAECESVRNNCYCENANDDEVCEKQCFMSAGLYDQCVEDDNDNQNNNGQQEEEFELQEALECARLDIDEEAAAAYQYQNQGGNGNYNYNWQQGQQQEMEFFVGPYCSANGKKILLGMFLDETCSFAAPDGAYEKFHYGKSLPYSSKSIISNECISCAAPEEDDGNNDNNNNGNYQYQEPELLEFCERVYEPAGKCETNLNVYGIYPNTLACQFIKGLNSWGKARITASLGEMKKNVTSAGPAAWAWFFAATTAIFGGVAFYYNKKLQKQADGLVRGEGTMM